MTVSFQTVIGPDGVIHLPPNVPRPEGNVEVVVTERAEPPPEQPPLPEAPKRHMFQDLIDFAQTQDWSQVPTDLAKNHDHYAHGAPKGIDDE